MAQHKEIYIFDTSALLAYIEDEDGAEDVETLFIKAESGDAEIYISFISLTEIFYITIQERGEAEASNRIKLIQSLAVKIVESYEDLNLNAGKLKAANRVSLADSFIAALSQEYKGILVHKDPEFENISSPLREYRLPYKSPKQ
jgi:predicted nucleic acid-binding protein